MSEAIRELESVAKALEALNKLWSPHPKQIPVGRAIFRDGVKRIMLVMGRRFGKSVLIANTVIRVALSKPYSACVILCPTIKASRSIYWHSGVIKRMLPMDFVESINNTEGRVTFTNGSYLLVTGADDPDSLRGTGIAIYAVDEAKDHRPNVLGTITPALIDGNGILLVGGTPPGSGGAHHFWDWAATAQTDPKWRYFHGTSYDNPYLDHALIDEEKRQHEARGEQDVFTREYLAMPAQSIKYSVYGMFNRATHVRPYEVLRADVLRRPTHWTFVAALDPGSSSVFAVLLGAVNNHTGEVRFLDEIYADRVMETSIGSVWPRVQAKMREIYDPDPQDNSQWFVVYDEAARWAQVELQDVFDINAFPTQKALNRKSFGVSLIKDLYLRKQLLVSDRCVKFMEETEAYQTDDKGGFVKERDHLLDCSRYLLHAAAYTAKTSTPAADPQEIPEDERRRAFTPEEDWSQLIGDIEPYLLDLMD